MFRIAMVAAAATVLLGASGVAAATTTTQNTTTQNATTQKETSRDTYTAHIDSKGLDGTVTVGLDAARTAGTIDWTLHGLDNGNVTIRMDGGTCEGTPPTSWAPRGPVTPYSRTAPAAAPTRCRRCSQPRSRPIWRTIVASPPRCATTASSSPASPSRTRCDPPPAPQGQPQPWGNIRMTADAIRSNIRPGAGRAVDPTRCVVGDAHEVASDRVAWLPTDQRLTTLLAASLRGQGYAVDVATTAEDGIELAGEVPYDAIVLDVGLPDGDGIDLCADCAEAACGADVRAHRLPPGPRPGPGTRCPGRTTTCPSPFPWMSSMRDCEPCSAAVGSSGQRS